MSTSDALLQMTVPWLRRATAVSWYLQLQKTRQLTGTICGRNSLSPLRKPSVITVSAADWKTGKLKPRPCGAGVKAHLLKKLSPRLSVR